MIEDLFTPQHLIILFVILFFLFGAKKLPGLGKSLGHGIREFRGGIAGLDDDAPGDELTADDDQATLAAGDAAAQTAGASAPPDASVASDAAAVTSSVASTADASTADAPAAADAAATAADPALDDADIEDADYTELDGDVVSEVVGEMSEAEGAVASPGPQS